jgi:hypothetical protein
MKTLKLLPAFVLIGLILSNCSFDKDWRTASRESAGIAPEPSVTNEAVLHIYGAKAWGWRGWFHGQPVLRITQDIPDRYWYGEKPRILKAHRGTGVDELIDAVDKAAYAYPWKTTYKAFPGPNSNTFSAWIAKQVPELELDLPFSAIGSGYVD